ncbi:glycosyl hydrolase [Parvularcula dongshanensis]|uniref:Mannan endo-1,4-beta-mannosidase n=1 Tax=Parvularcula dongshanensis TaxID=1173995 RepID=A0A840I7Y7_9PROT|nr:glycosyl hydrolase [Parvularcula dongshanensis]MBB4660373.1 mannan endo-1,4-beta-mannosidase [Parvularcula dongshanensis]
MRVLTVKKRTLSLAAVSTAALVFGACNSTAQSDPGEMAERQGIALEYLAQLSDEGKLLAGTQVNEYEVFLECDSMDRLVTMLDGEEPAVLGLELMFAKEYPPYEDVFVEHAVRHGERGGLVNVVWHQRNPLHICPRGEFYTCSQTPMSEAELAKVLTEGTEEYRLWREDVAAAAKTLRRLIDEDVLVFWRPYHEMNGGWFWWGQKASYPQLWDALYDALDEEGVAEDMIWVWSANRATPDAENYFPERHMPDVVGSDVYENDNDSHEYYGAAENIRPLAEGAPYALTEVGRAPSEDVVAETQPAWVLLWGGEYLNADWRQTETCDHCNTAEETRAFFARDAIVSLEEVPDEVRAALAGGEPEPVLAERPACAVSLLEG